jgi:hypothetical protein
MLCQKSLYEYRKRKMFEWMLHECCEKSDYYEYRKQKNVYVKVTWILWEKSLWMQKQKMFK